jgi:hypothetical protein
MDMYSAAVAFHPAVGQLGLMPLAEGHIIVYWCLGQAKLTQLEVVDVSGLPPSESLDGAAIRVLELTGQSGWMRLGALCPERRHMVYLCGPTGRRDAVLWAGPV